MEAQLIQMLIDYPTMSYVTGSRKCKVRFCASLNICYAGFLTFEQRGAAKAAAHLLFLAYLSCPTEFSIALRHIPRAIKA